MSPVVALAAWLGVSNEGLLVVGGAVLVLTSAAIVRSRDEIAALAEACGMAIQGAVDNARIFFAERNPAQDTALTPGERKKLDKVGGAEEVKKGIVGPRTGPYDLYKQGWQCLRETEGRGGRRRANGL